MRAGNRYDEKELKLKMTNNIWTDEREKANAVINTLGTVDLKQIETIDLEGFILKLIEYKNKFDIEYHKRTGEFKSSVN